MELRLEGVERAEFGTEGVVPTLDSFGDGGEGMIHCDDRVSDDNDCSSRRLPISSSMLSSIHRSRWIKEQ